MSPNGPNGPTGPRHSCDLCVAVTTLLDGFLDRTATGLRDSLTAQAKASGRAGQGDLWTRHKGFEVVDLQTITARLDEQHVHTLAAVVAWWVRQSLVTFKGDVLPLENAIVNAFRENGIEIYEPPKEAP